MKRIFVALAAAFAMAGVASAQVPDFLPRLTRNTSDMIFNGIRETPKDYYHVLAGIEMYEYDSLCTQRPSVIEGEFGQSRKERCIDVRLDFSCLTVSGGCRKAYFDYIFSSDKKELQKVVMTVTSDSLSTLEGVCEDFSWTAHCLTGGMIERENEPHCWEGDGVVIREPAEAERFMLPALDDTVPDSVMYKYAFSMTVSFSGGKQR